MEQVNELRKRYCPRALALAVIAGAILIVLDMKPIGRGIILGTLASILNFLVMSHALPLAVLKSSGGGMLRSLGSVLVRYLLMAAALFVGYHYDGYDFFAVAGGLFSVQLVILADHLYQGIRKKN
ncbi:MAG: ATP synthase subunit I [Desulfatibacillum sp.]|nr:ATP synthase subunit I [Desulfatibacillum sp.]